jgi:hypothetical protein
MIVVLVTLTLIKHVGPLSSSSDASIGLAAVSCFE